MCIENFLFFFLCKTEQPIWDMELQEKEEEKDEKHKRKMFRVNLTIKGIY